MAKVLITLLSILLLLNAMTFLLVAFQDPGGEATAEDGVPSGAAIKVLTSKVDKLTRKMDELRGLKTTLTKQLNDMTRTLTRKIDGVTRAQAAALRAVPSREMPSADDEAEEEPEDEVEDVEGEGGQG